MAASPRTRVYLTVDVECAEERLRGGTFQPALGHDLRIWGRFPDRREDLGVPLLLRELERAGLEATFFVEALGARHFGEDQHRELCRRLLDAGQDVQLHLHPVQLAADWHTRGRARAPDDLAAYDLATQARLLRDGLDALARCGVPREALSSFRAGNYGASNDTWRALREAGLWLDSSYNLSYLDRSCRIRRPAPENALFETDVPGVWELPISNFADGAGRLRHVEITAVSFAETEHFLREARRLRIPEVTIVTHSFEFFFLDSISPPRGRPNEVNTRRLRDLLALLARERDAFEVDTVGALSRRLREGAAAPARAAAAAVPRGRAALRWSRYVEQGRKRVASAIPFLA